MRKPSDDFLNLLFEAIKNRNDYGVDTKDKNAPFFKQFPKLNFDYTYRGLHSYIPDSFKKEKKDIYKKEELADTITSRNEKKTELKKIESDIEGSDTLFKEKSQIEISRVFELKKDLRFLSQEIDKIKKLDSTYAKSLKTILAKFFTVPGAKIAKRYLFLPLKKNVNFNQVNEINKASKDGKADLIMDAMTTKEVIVNPMMDDRIKIYLKNYGYYFKDEKNDLYNDTCYTKNNAKVKISDEFAKIEKIDVLEKQRAMEKMTDLTKRKFLFDDIMKRKNYTENFMARMDIINSETIKSGDYNDTNVIVITWVPRSIMSQSTDTIWTSCMHLPTNERDDPGSNVKYIPSGIENGVFIAWLVNIKDMKTMSKPIARILIKPYVVKNISSSQFFWWPSKVYFDGSSSNDINVFKSAINNFCYLKQMKEIRQIEKKYSQYTFQVDRSQYDDDGDYEKKILNMKSIFSQDSNEHNFFNAIDYTPKKAIAYLKRSKKTNEHLNEYLLWALKAQDLTVFDYLSKIAKDQSIVGKAVNAYFYHVNAFHIKYYNYNFMIYLLKYYFQKYVEHVEMKKFIIGLISKNGRADIAKYVFSNNMHMSVLFDSKKSKSNYSILTDHMIDLYFKDVSKPFNYEVFKDMMTPIIKLNMVNAYFSVNDEKEIDLNIFRFYRFFELNLDDFSDKGVKKVWIDFFDQIKTKANIVFMKHYIKDMFENSFVLTESKNKKHDRVRNILLYFIERLPDNSPEIRNVMQCLNGALLGLNNEDIDMNFFKKIIDLKKNSLDIDSNISKILKLLNKKEFDDLIDTRLSDTKLDNKQKFYLISKMIFDLTQDAESNVELFDKVNNFVLMLPTYATEETKCYKLLMQYMNCFYSVKFEDSVIKIFETYDEKINVKHINWYFFNLTYRYENSDTQTLIDNMKYLMAKAKVKKAELDTSSIINLLFKKNNFDEKLLNFLHETVDFTELKNEMKKINDEGGKSKNGYGYKFLFDLTNTKLLHELYNSTNMAKNKPFLADIFDKHLVRSGIIINKIINNLSALSDSEKKNIKFLFENDFNVALDIVVNSMNAMPKNKIYVINFLVRVFDGDFDDFYSSPEFKDAIKTFVEIDKKLSYISFTKDFINNTKEKNNPEAFDLYFKDCFSTSEFPFFYNKYIFELIEENKHMKYIENNIDKYASNVEKDKTHSGSNLQFASSLAQNLLGIIRNNKDKKIYDSKMTNKILDSIAIAINNVDFNDKSVISIGYDVFYYTVLNVNEIFETYLPIRKSPIYFDFAKKTIKTFAKYIVFDSIRNEIKDIEYEQINSDKSITLDINNVDFSDVKQLSLDIKNRLIILYEILNKNGMKIVVNVNEK